ncbi:MAG: hypothetical protein IKN12_02355, partial [Selenomonadaceae bacterium]|nr:hypothetical protein [Selenomonadaceae bacterium]
FLVRRQNISSHHTVESLPTHPRYNEGVQAGMQAGREEMKDENEKLRKEIARLQRQILMMSKSSKPAARRGR